MAVITFRTVDYTGVLTPVTDITVNGVSYGSMPLGIKSIIVPDNSAVGVIITPVSGPTYVQVINIYTNNITFNVAMTPAGTFAYRLNIIENPSTSCLDLYASGNNAPNLPADTVTFAYDTIPTSGSFTTLASGVMATTNHCLPAGDYNFRFQYSKASSLLWTVTVEQSIPFTYISGSGATGTPNCNVLALNCQALLSINGELNPSCASIGQDALINVYASFPALAAGSGSGSGGCTQTVRIEFQNLSTGETVIDTTFDWADLGSLTPPQLSILQPLTEFGKYYLKVTLDDCGNELICEKNLDVCFEISIDKQDCYKYRFFDTTDYSNYTDDSIIHTVTVKDTDGTYQQTYTTDITNSEYVDIVFPHDGIYTVEVANEVTGTVKTYIVYELCALMECYRALVLKVLCNEDDPCCENCDPNKKEKLKQDRAELNKLVALYITLFAFVQKDKINYQGIFTVNDERQLQLEYISGIMDQINIITARCGECEQVKINSKPCRSC